jgi:hypothetical protein
MERHDCRLAFGGGVWKVSRRSRRERQGLGYREPAKAEPAQPPSPSALPAFSPMPMPVTDAAQVPAHSLPPALDAAQQVRRQAAVRAS